MCNIEKRVLGKLYEILATLNYNRERREVMERVLERFLVTLNPNLDIRKEAKVVLDSYEGLNYAKDDITKTVNKILFGQKSVLLSNIPTHLVEEYIVGKFSSFEKYFERTYSFDMYSPLLFAFVLNEYIEFKKRLLNFSDASAFKSTEEYIDIGYVSIPSKKYIEKWRNISTLSESEIRRITPLCKSDMDKVIELLSIDINDLGVRKEYNLHIKPLLKVGDTLILLAPYYIIKGLPSIYELLFRGVKKYREKKGKYFEKLSQDTIKHLPFELLAYNVKYSGGETDAILRFRDSVWFVEVRSHPPSEKALKGDWKAIEKDLNRTIKKCISQGEKCLKNLDKEPLKTFSRSAKTKGIIVILDGVYPQLNPNIVFTFHKKDFPVYIINWFDLRVLMEQPEVEHFEEFLLWRKKKPMPIICLDEKDYWAFYFDRYKSGQMKQVFRHLQKNQNPIFYISRRFNSKEYLRDLVKGQPY